MEHIPWSDDIPIEEVIVIGSLRMISQMDWISLPQAPCDGTLIPYSENVKYIDITFSWSPQSQNVFAYCVLRYLRGLRNFSPTSTKIVLTQCLLFPILDYADASY